MKRTIRSSHSGLEDFGVLQKDVNKAVRSVMSTTGEVSSSVYAEHLLDLIENESDEGFVKFFKELKSNYDIDTRTLIDDVKNYSIDKSDENLKKVSQASEPKWFEIFKRLNATSNGTYRLVKLRERIKNLKDKNLLSFDSSLLTLFKYWFNPSFLVLEKVDWSTPANILEKIIAYEAVHEINSWADLRARLAPPDRKCFAFFHPLIPEEPLIFVEVALCKNIPGSINQVIKIERNIINPGHADTAVFYSISNCQNGLAGVSFGNFLIKKVAHDLKIEFPHLERFVTLSPVPGLMRWIEINYPDLHEKYLNGQINNESFLKKTLLYLTKSNREDGLPNDPVSRFHLGNGAILEKINLNADNSKKGVSESLGLMVNYLYDLDVVEKNHELFFKTKVVQVSHEIELLKKKL
jgi:malonyl-CoA decarboxylase|tara:strand:- start:225 stop:1448 length:1224 start_codon:yes stop_codon:yes gene_type:complete